jgi:hypothetical protein
MNLDFVIEYIPSRMKELGYRKGQYHIRFHHYVLQPQQKIRIEAFNELYLLSEVIEDISIESASGVFDLSQQNISRQEYEHQGLIKIENQSDQVRHIKLVQVLPAKGKKQMNIKNEKPC